MLCQVSVATHGSNEARVVGVPKRCLQLEPLANCFDCSCEQQQGKKGCGHSGYGQRRIILPRVWSRLGE